MNGPTNQQVSRGLSGIRDRDNRVVFQDEHLHISRIDASQRNIGGTPRARFADGRSELQEFGFGLGPVRLVLAVNAAMTFKYLEGTVLNSLPQQGFKRCATIFGDEENIVLRNGF